MNNRFGEACFTLHALDTAHLIVMLLEGAPFKSSGAPLPMASGQTTS